MRRKPKPSKRYLHHYIMKHRSQREWLKLINQIGNEVIRKKVVAIVWWDWFSEEDKPQSYIKKIVATITDADALIADEELVMQELIRIGYKPKRAAARAKVSPDTLPEELKRKQQGVK